MPARNLVRAVAVLSLLALGCHHGSSPSEPIHQDAISLVSISPAEKAVLPYGSKVDFTVRVRYSFASAARGKVLLTAFPGNPIPTGPPMFTDPISFPVEGREGEATLRSTVYFNLDPLPPKNSPITLDFSLFPEGVDRTSISFSVLYQLGS